MFLAPLTERMSQTSHYPPQYWSGPVCNLPASVYVDEMGSAAGDSLYARNLRGLSDDFLDAERRVRAVWATSSVPVRRKPSNKPQTCRACQLCLPTVSFSVNQRTKPAPRCKACVTKRTEDEAAAAATAAAHRDRRAIAESALVSLGVERTAAQREFHGQILDACLPLFANAHAPKQ